MSTERGCKGVGERGVQEEVQEGARGGARGRAGGRERGKGGTCPL